MSACQPGVRKQEVGHGEEEDREQKREKAREFT